MRKILILLLTVAVMTATFIGCAEKTSFGSTSADTNGNGLRDDVELKILKAHHKKNGMDKYEKLRLDIHDIVYFGKYNGAYIVGLSCGYSSHPDTNDKSAINSEGLTNEKLFSSDWIGIIAWYRGELKSLLSLQESGVLGDDDLNEIRGKVQEYRNKKTTE